MSHLTVVKGQLHLIAKELVGIVTRGRRGRTEREVQQHYDGEDAEDPKRKPNQQPVYYRMPNGALVRVHASSMIHLAMVRLGDMIQHINPKSVCEVGCGNGRNLLYLKERFPGLFLRGYDISPVCVKRCVHAGLDVQCGDAYQLPALAGSFQLVFTFAALEQMQNRIDEALFQIKRLSSQYALFYEPFADINGPLDRLFLWSKNYFRMHSRDLPKYGFKPLIVRTDFAKKPTFGYAMVLCEVMK